MPSGAVTSTPKRILPSRTSISTGDFAPCQFSGFTRGLATERTIALLHINRSRLARELQHRDKLIGQLGERRRKDVDTR